MKKKKFFMITTIIQIVLFLSPICMAEENDAGTFSGSFLVGSRFVDVGKSETKYDQHFNLHKGPRLFDFEINYTPNNTIKKYFDSFQVNLSHFGGDPFESFNVKMVKFGEYDFKYQRRKSTYFYDDIILPQELSSYLVSNGGDFHSFNFDRIIDNSSLVSCIGRSNSNSSLFISCVVVLSPRFV